MIRFTLNGNSIHYQGDENKSLLKFLRNDQDITSVKDGCNGQAFCGACLIEINGAPRLSCITLMSQLEGAHVITTEGIPENVRHVIASAFVNKAAVQCGFCTPGLIMRTKILFSTGEILTKEEIGARLKAHFCRCTGYVKIIEAVDLALKTLYADGEINEYKEAARVGSSYPKYQAYETAIGRRKFTDDLKFEGMLHGALCFSKYPRARVKKIDVSSAEKIHGVYKVFTAKDITGERKTGLIVKDWPMMIAQGETTAYIGDVICSVVAESEEIARFAANLIHIEYEVLEPVSDPYDALKPDATNVHDSLPNLLENCIVKRGASWDDVLIDATYVSSGFYRTQRIEHAFLETESATCLPDGDGIHLYGQGQGIYVDRSQLALMLGIDKELVRVTLLPAGGGFGGKEDITVQGHAALCAYLLKKPVKFTLTREESVRMHPKRHPVYMDISLACDTGGKLTGLRLRAVGDTGAYASVGTKVMERVAGHAAGAYHIPSVDIEAMTVYTNNIPSGAMRGFGVNQVVFALESCIDELCEKGNFDRWQFRFNNALTEGSMTATGQVLKQGVGVKAALLAVRDAFTNAKFAGIACGIKNCGIGNGMVDFSHVSIDIRDNGSLLVKHGWTDMGQGISNVVIQIIAQETGLPASKISVETDTEAGLETGMTTSSRATVLLGNAVMDAARKISKDLGEKCFSSLFGKKYTGYSECDFTTAPSDTESEVVTHFSYGYAAQVVILDDNGQVSKVVAAHDAGKIMNKALFEGQIEGAVVMGLGYALSEDLLMENSELKSSKLKDMGLLRSVDVPDIEVIGIEVPDAFGPYGAKGVGEIGLVPTAAAVANAMYSYDKVKRFALPINKKNRRRTGS